MKNLKLLRQKYGLSQSDLASILNLSQQSIYKYENGISEPSIETLISLATYFDTSVDYLIGNIPNHTEVNTGDTSQEILDTHILFNKIKHLDSSTKKHLSLLIDDFLYLQKQSKNSPHKKKNSKS